MQARHVLNVVLMRGDLSAADANEVAFCTLNLYVSWFAPVIPVSCSCSALVKSSESRTFPRRSLAPPALCSRDLKSLQSNKSLTCLLGFLFHSWLHASTCYIKHIQNDFCFLLHRQRSDSEWVRVLYILTFCSPIFCLIELFWFDIFRRIIQKFYSRDNAKEEKKYLSKARYYTVAWMISLTIQ